MYYEDTMNDENSNKLSELNIGFSGYCVVQYDEENADKLIKEAFDKIQEDNPKCKKYNLVSGVTNIGTVRQAYKEAESRGWDIYGIACNRVEDFEWYPGLSKDKVTLVGENWGEESDFFIDNIHALIRVGGGYQSLMECAKAKIDKKPTYEYETRSFPNGQPFRDLISNAVSLTLVERDKYNYIGGLARFCEIWAILMEEAINGQGKNLEDVAEELCFKALDIEDISGYQYGFAIDVLSRCWDYGDQLRKWHNKKYGIENDEGGVINPAILIYGSKQNIEKGSIENMEL